MLSELMFQLTMTTLKTKYLCEVVRFLLKYLFWSLEKPAGYFWQWRYW